ncbi:hypothetical protein QE152_g3582 [Popillia japonica]|uniref:WW domain-containing protein n=1 Tax=Popillia japonica TaxID=7064 RepID=A0AAW1N532_POPJA
MEIDDSNTETGDNQQESKTQAENSNQCPFRNGIYNQQESKTQAENSNQCPFRNGIYNSNNTNSIRRFHVLDEIENESDSDRSEYSDSDIPDEEVEQMLEEALIKKKRTASEANSDEEVKPFEQKEKVILIEKGHNHFEVLPEGWVQVTHNSGMHLYLHKTTRVCTLSKPYFLGPGSARKHEVPLSAIPCLSYKRAIDAEIEKQNHPASDLPNARIETIKENIETQNLNPAQLKDYCEKLFQFKTI